MHRTNDDRANGAILWRHVQQLVRADAQFALSCLVQLAILGCGDGRGDSASGGASGFGSVGDTLTASDGTSPTDGDGSGGGPTEQSGGNPSDPSDPSSPSESGDADTNPNTASGTEDGTRFDLPPGGDGMGDDGTTPAGGCRIDFLFVIDSSCSMGNDQDNINASLSGFVSTIETRFGEHDHHIMVVDTDELNFDEIAACRTACSFGLATTCGAIPCAMLPPDDMCNTKLGVGLTGNSDFPCNFLGGKRYIIDGQPDLNPTFYCVAGNRTDTGLTDEKAAGALLGAISPEMNAPGGCNDGFLRRDAILVVTMITDEDDDPNDHLARITMDDDLNSVGDPTSWKQAVVDAKNGDENAVVMLGLLGDQDVATGGTWCPPIVTNAGEQTGIEGAEETPRLRQLSESFPNGMWAGICEPNYAPFFDQAVSVIDAACEAFVPPPE